MMDIGNTKVMELLRQRDHLLTSNPDLCKMQAQYEYRMRNAGSDTNRLMLAKRFLKDQLEELQEAIKDLSSELVNFTNANKAIKLVDNE